ncbi:MAG: hypothetical protein ACREL7_14000 [Longimicrobiales bacterium]
MRKALFALAIAAVMVPGSAAGQIAWDSPLLLPPRAQPGFGIFLADVAGGDLGVMALWRSPSWNFGLRGGLAEAAGNDLGVYGGIDFEGALTSATEEFPLDIDWVFGAGLGASDGVLISLPLGLTIGHEFEGDGVGFLPYVTPRVVLDACLDCGRGDDDDDDVSLDFAADLGLDLRLTSAFVIRFGATLGDREGVAVGLMF